MHTNVKINKYQSIYWSIHYYYQSKQYTYICVFIVSYLMWESYNTSINMPRSFSVIHLYVGSLQALSFVHLFSSYVPSSEHMETMFLPPPKKKYNIPIIVPICSNIPIHPMIVTIKAIYLYPPINILIYVDG